MFFIVSMLTGMVLATADVQTQHPLCHLDEISETPAARIKGVWVGGELIELKTQEDVDAFFQDQKAYMEKHRAVREK